MTILGPAAFRIVFAIIFCGSLTVGMSARGEAAETPGTNPACERIQRNTTLSITASTRSISITLVNRDQAPLWVPPKVASSSVDAKVRMATIWYGYFKEIYPGYLSGHYVIRPMKKVGPNQKFRWDIVPSPGTMVDTIVPGSMIMLRMRVALKSIVSRGRGDQLQALLAESCVIETSARMPSK